MGSKLNDKRINYTRLMRLRFYFAALEINDNNLINSEENCQIKQNPSKAIIAPITILKSQ